MGTNLIRKRGSLKKQLGDFGKFINTLKVEFDQQQTIAEEKLVQLESRVYRAENFYVEFDNVQSQIVAAAEEIDVEVQEEIRKEFDDIYHELLARAKFIMMKTRKKIEELNNTNNQTNANVPQQQCVNLPKIELPKFSGSYFNWLEFRDTFESLINRNKQISDIDKFHYLKSALSGEAAQVIKAIELAASNYSSAWELLCNRYSNQRLLVFNHTKALFNLEPIHRESAIKLRKLIDDISKHLTALKSLKQPTDAWDTLIIYIITTKLDANTLKEWEEFRSNKDIPTLEDMKQFLMNRADIIETIELRDRRFVKPKETKSLLTLDQTCPICNGKHFIQNCEKFLKLVVTDRVERVKQANLCTNCLRRGHLVKKCKAGKCRLCNAAHNTLLHTDKTRETKPLSNSESVVEPTKIGSYIATKGKQILLSTISLSFLDAENRPHNIRAVLDSGSQSSFVSQELCERYGLTISKLKLTVSGLSNVATPIKGKCTVDIKSNNSNFQMKLECFVMQEITGNLPDITFDKAQLNLPDDIELADPTFNETNKIEMLIGADHFWDIICPQQRRLGKHMPVLQQTKFGWIVSGPIGRTANTQFSRNLLSTNDIQEQLSKFWELEENVINPIKGWSEEERACEDNFIQNTSRTQDGRFIVTLPLKLAPENLGDSRTQAEKRFFNLERRLKNDQENHMYQDFMNEYEKLGHMRKIQDNKLGYYMPHHGVLKRESLTTKLRVVFDASARTTTGLSLNDIQMTGPTIQDDLVSILLRFREHAFVVAADISKMYRRVLVNPSQRSLQKILWRRSPAEELGTYELQTVTYGTKAASFLATRSLNQLAQDIKDKYPEIARIIEKDFYVDDLLTGNDSSEKAAQNCKAVVDILNGGCFPLRKFCSNDPNTLKYIAKKENELSVIDLGPNENTKTLGLIWCPNEDELLYRINQDSESSITKRSVLSNTAQIFDPVGLLTPCIITAKLIMQQLWLEKMDWDDELPERLRDEWIKFRSELKELNKLRIPRHVICKRHTKLELHGFSDASEKAYGGCVYVRSTNVDGRVTARLLCAKARVAPIKTISIPRLELCAALLLTKLMKKTASSILKKFDKYVYWTDSTIVLGWLKMPPRCLKTFVSNRTAEIQELSADGEWRHVPTKQNPADLLSRGVMASKIRESELWWHGPTWLVQAKHNWPDIKHRNEHVPEMRDNLSTCVLVTQKEPFPYERFSSLCKMKRTVAFMMRFKNNCLAKPNDRRRGVLTMEEMNTAFLMLIKSTQTEAFQEDLRNLEQGKELSKRSKILELKPFIDENNIIRVGGRISNSKFEFEKKHPIILPQGHLLTKLIFQHYHIKLQHAGPSLLLASIREKYWPISGRNCARQTTRKCIQCFRCKPRFTQQCMGDLPEKRLTPSTPFTICGVDYMGPFQMKDRKGRGCKITKCYVSLFICFTTKAIHLELVTDLTKDAFILALRRFIARRGKPTRIYSDNGTNFVGANNELKELGQFLHQNEATIIEGCTKEEIEWNFTPPHAPHFGGLWEAGVKSTRHHLKRVLGNATLTYEQLYTILVQIEATLNSRPLSPLSSNPDDLNPLTPGHFLVGRSLLSAPDADYSHLQPNRLSAYQHLQAIQQHFWKRWSLEYIAELQQRNRWKTTKGEIKVGDLCLIKDDNQPPMRWKLGRVQVLHPGKDGVSRVATLRTQGGSVKRAVKNICPLPVTSE